MSYQCDARVEFIQESRHKTPEPEIPGHFVYPIPTCMRRRFYHLSSTLYVTRHFQTRESGRHRSAGFRRRHRHLAAGGHLRGHLHLLRGHLLRGHPRDRQQVVGQRIGARLLEGCPQLAQLCARSKGRARRHEVDAQASARRGGRVVRPAAVPGAPVVQAGALVRVRVRLRVRVSGREGEPGGVRARVRVRVGRRAGWRLPLACAPNPNPNPNPNPKAPPARICAIDTMRLGLGLELGLGLPPARICAMDTMRPSMAAGSMPSRSAAERSSARWSVSKNCDAVPGYGSG